MVVPCTCQLSCTPEEKKLTPEGELAQAFNGSELAPSQLYLKVGSGDQLVQVQQILSEIVSSQEKMLVHRGMFRPQARLLAAKAISASYSVDALQVATRNVCARMPAPLSPTLS